MKQQSAIISRFWATTANAPRRATPRVHKTLVVPGRLDHADAELGSADSGGDCRNSTDA